MTSIWNGTDLDIFGIWKKISIDLAVLIKVQFWSKDMWSLIEYKHSTFITLEKTEEIHLLDVLFGFF